MNQVQEWVEIEDSAGQPARVPAYRYRASQDGYHEISEPAFWLDGVCLTRRTGAPPAVEGGKGTVRIARKRITFKAGEEVLIPASENIHQFQCDHEDCIQRKLYCRKDEHAPYKRIVGGNLMLTRVALTTALSPMLEAHEEKLALQRRPVPMPQLPQPPAPTDTDSLFMAKVREARAARANGGAK